MSRLMLLIPALVLLMLSIPLSVAAQDATPAATPPAGTIFPDPSDCKVDPRPMSFLQELAATPQAVPPDADQRFSRPGEEPREWTMPAGTPADTETVDGITATLHEAMACLNANDPLRFLALFSDEMIQLFFALDPVPPDALPAMEAASPVSSPPEMWLGLIGLHDARVLPDGRVAALGDSFDPTEPPYGVGTDFAIFVKVGDRWLIDSLIEHVVIVGEATPAA